MQNAGWIEDIIRTLFGAIDSVIYGFIDYTYKMFVYLSRLVILDQEQMHSITDRIYLILGIVMLFKVAFSLVSYLAKPDDFTNGEKGIANIVKRIIISLVMLTFVGNVFTIAYRFQAIVLEDNIIPNFVLGASEEEGTGIHSVSTAGKSISFQIFSSFFKLNEITSSVDYCEPSDNGVYVCTDGAGGMSSDDVKKMEIAYNNKEVNYLLALVNVSVDDEGTDNNSSLWGFAAPLFDSFYAFEYSIGISAIVGFIVLLIFVSFVFDVVIRLAKLTFLQLIAPIPIIAYIDPKGGDKIFKNWVKEVTTTYISLFIKLAVVFFAIYLCTQVSEFGVKFFNATTGKADAISGGGFHHGLAVTLVIIGILLFAKEVPKLLEGLFGFKSSGFSLNPMKRLRQVPILSKTATGLSSRVVGGITGLRYDQTNNKGRAFINGWSAGKHAMKGKVGLMGGDGKSNKVFRTSLSAAYKETTGSEWKTISPTKMLLTRGARRDQEAIKKGYLNPLRTVKNGMESDLRNNRSHLNGLYNSKLETSKEIKIAEGKLADPHVSNAKKEEYENYIKARENLLNTIKTNISSAEEKDKKLSKAILDIDKDISLYADQVKDFAKTYDLDESTADKLKKANSKIDSTRNIQDNEIKMDALKNKYLK